MNPRDIQTAILAGSSPEHMQTLCNISSAMFDALAQVQGYGQDEQLSNFANFFNELTALGDAAIRQVRASKHMPPAPSSEAVAASQNLVARFYPAQAPAPVACVDPLVDFMSWTPPAQPEPQISLPAAFPNEEPPAQNPVLKRQNACDSATLPAKETLPDPYPELEAYSDEDEPSLV